MTWRAKQHGAGFHRREDLVAKCLDGFHLDTTDVQQFGIPFIAKFKSVAGVADKTVTLPFKAQVIRATYIMTDNGGAGDTLQVFNGTDAITEALDTSAKSTKDSGAFATIDTTKSTIAALGTLKLTQASDALAEVIVWMIRIP